MNPTIHLYFQIHYSTQLGQSIFIIGNIPQFGSWNPLQAFKLNYNQGGIWSGVLKLPQNQVEPIEYKYILNKTTPTLNGVVWEDGGNRTIDGYCLQKVKQKKEQFFHDKWSYRTLKLKLKYNLISNDEALYVIGSSHQIGNWHTPVRMIQKRKEGQQIWKINLDINALYFWMRYYYVIKNEKQETMIWERGPGRVIETKHLVQPVYQGQDKHYFVKKQDDYDYSEQSNGYKYYISFGTYVIEDSFFDTSFQFDQINENIFVGPCPQLKSDIEELKKQHIKCILNLQTDHDIIIRGIKLELMEQLYKHYGIQQIRFEIKDMNIDDFIFKGSQVAELIDVLIQKYKIIYIHCTCGIGRAPSSVVAYLNRIKKYRLQDAIKLVKQRRKQFYVHEFMLSMVSMKD